MRPYREMRVRDRFIRGEVARQGFNLNSERGRARVHWMQSAWVWAARKAEDTARPSVQDILFLGYMVEPEENPQGFRKVPVVVRGQLVVDWPNVPNALERLWEHGGDLAPERFYYEFEMIHPFTDGNGRVGAILYNWLLGTLPEPEIPPDVFLGYESGWRKLMVDYDEGAVGYVVEPEDDVTVEEDGCCSAGWWEPCCTGDEEPQ